MEAGPSRPKKSRGSVNIINEKLVATLDKCQISDRNAVRIITAVVESCGCNPSTLIINRVSIHNYREQMRKKLSERIKNLFPSFQLCATVLHWDGKLLRDISKNKTVDRLAIIISDGEIEQILSIPGLEDGTGSTQASAIAEVPSMLYIFL